MAIFLLILALFFSFRFSDAVELTLDQPGIYVLGADITISPAAADAAIIISSSTVVLDLNNQVIRQSGATLGVDGIRISSGINDVTIKNGIVQDFSRFGIAVNSNCHRIRIENVQANSCLDTAFDFTGAPGLLIQDSAIIDCSSYGCTLGIDLNLCNNFDIRNFRISQMVPFGASTRTAFQAAVCTGLVIENVRVTSSDVGLEGFRGLLLDSCNNCSVTDYRIESCAGTTVTGFRIQGTSQACSFDDCSILNCSATTAFFGFASTAVPASGGNNFIFKNCLVSTNASLGAFRGISATLLTDSEFNGCQVIGCTGAASSAGFEADISSSLIVDTIIQNNTTSVGTFTAFNLLSGSEMIIDNCVALDNTAVDAITGFGLTAQTVSSLINCIAQGNSCAGGGIQPANGFLLNASTNCSLTGCTALFNLGGTANGFFIVGSTQARMDHCSALSNLATGLVAGSVCTGFTFGGASTGCSINDCRASFNRSATSSGSGLVFLTGGGSSECSVFGSLFTNNTGPTDALSFGVFLGAGNARVLFTQNQSFRNGATIGNQFSGVAAGSQNTANTTASISSITEPWTNVAIVT